MKRVIILIAIAFLIAAGSAVGLLMLRHKTPPLATSATPNPNPLSIDAVRRHALTPSQITFDHPLTARGGCTTSVVSFTSDGYKEYSLVQVPTTAKPTAGYPVLILAHGYIDPAQYRTDGSDYQEFINYFCDHGYIVFKPDFRGHGQSEGSALGGHFDSGYTYDLLNLSASLKSFAGANANDIALLGHSMGGHVVLRAAVADHGLPIKAYVTAAGVVGSLEDIAYHWPPQELPPDLVQARAQILAQVGSPQQNPAFWHDGSSINYVDDIRAPFQINHGDADKTVPLAFAQHLDNALTAAHKQHEFYVYPGGDHQFSEPTVRALFLQRALAFLNANLK